MKIGFLKSWFKGDDLAALVNEKSGITLGNGPITNLDLKAKQIYGQCILEGKFNGWFKDSRISAIKSTLKDLDRQKNALKLANFMKKEVFRYNSQFPNQNFDEYVKTRKDEIIENRIYPELDKREISVAFERFSSLNRLFFISNVFYRMYEIENSIEMNTGLKDVKITNPRIIDPELAKSVFNIMNPSYKVLKNAKKVYDPVSARKLLADYTKDIKEKY